MPDILDLCRYTLELSPLAMVAVQGPTHLVRYANLAFCRLSGKTREALVGFRFADVVPEGPTNRCDSLLHRVYRRNETEALADQKHSCSFSDVYWSYTAWAILGPDNSPAGVMIEITDTSEARRNFDQAVALNEALILNGVKQQELDDALVQREQTIRRNEALALSLKEQNELTGALNLRLQRAVQETHHRVKNNLQIVAALAEIQMDGSSTVPVAALERIASHVRSLASLHDVLTQQTRQNDPGDAVNSAVAMEKLVALLQTSVGSRRILSDIASITLTIEKSASLSLLVSELVSNAAKHGAGDIAVTLTQNGETARLIVNDAGEGFPADFDPEAGVSTGMELVASLARHDLAGDLAFTNPPGGGACVTVTFPVSLGQNGAQE